MAINYFSENFLSSLRTSFNTIDYTRDDYPEEIQVAAAASGGIKHADIPVPTPKLDMSLILPKDDAKQVRLVYSQMQDLSDTQAADERLWAYMTHIHGWEYMVKRWSVATTTAKDKNEFIRDRYFLKTSNSRWLIRNGIARLWWFGRLTYTSSDQFALTDTLLSLQEIQAMLLERSFGKNPSILHGVLRFIANNMGELEARLIERYGETKKGYQQMGVYIGLLGGVSLLDAMSSSQIEQAVKKKFLA